MLTRRRGAWTLLLLTAAALIGLAVFFHAAPSAQAAPPLAAPQSVQNLTVQPGHQQLKLTWEARTSGGTPTGYDVQYTSTISGNTLNTDPSQGWAEWTHSGTATTATITGLTNGTAYRIRVRSTNADGMSGWQVKTAQTPRPTITLTSNATNGEVTEGDAAITLTATLSENASSAATVAVARVADDSTAAAGDIGSIANISISSGSNSGTTSLTIVNDQVDEDDETLKLEATASLYVAGELSLTIKDNDDAGVTVSETARTVEVGETTTYTVKLNSDPVTNVVITPTSTNTNQATVSGAMTFTGGSSGNWGSTQTVTITGKAVGTPDITHAVTSASTAGKYPTNLTINKVDVTVNASTKTYEITSAVSVTEADSAQAQLTVTLGRTVTSNFSLNVAYGYTTAGKATSADTGTTPTTVTVNANSSTATLTIPITNDALVEDQESFTATISTSEPGWNPSGTNKNRSTVTITDDEATTATIAFHGSNSGAMAVYTADVSESTATLNVPVTINHLPQANTDFDISIEATGTRRATEGASADYQITNKKVRFGPSTGKTVNLAVTIVNNALVEWDETISLKIDDSASSSLGRHYGLNANSRKATITIQDDERTAKINFDTATRTTKYTASPDEDVSGGSISVYVAVSHLPAASTTFAVEVLSSGTATERDSANPSDPYDFFIGTKEVTFGSTGSKRKPIIVRITNDDWVEDDQTIELQIVAADATPNDLGDFYARHADGSKATVTIEDDEWDNAKIAFNANAAATTKFTASPDEDVSGGKLSVPITISALPETDSEFTVSVLAGGTATENTDYSIAAKTFKFSTTDDSTTTDVDETTLSRNLEITITDDELVELDQTIELEIASSGTGYSSKYVRHAQGKLATITIQDDERPEANIEIGGTDTITKSTRVETPGQPGHFTTQTVVIIGTRTGAEGDGTLTVPIIINHLPESSVTFNVEVTGGKARETDDSDNPTGNPKDYEFVAKAVTFTPTGEKSMDLTINIEDDNVDEDDEDIELRIVAAKNPKTDLGDHYGRDPDESQAALIITDNDEVRRVTVTFSVAANDEGLYPVYEGNPTTMSVLTDIPVGPDGLLVTVERDTFDERSYLTDLAGICRRRGNHSIFACPNDFTLPAPFRIEEGQREATVNLVIRQDNRVENFAEWLHLRVHVGSGVALRSDTYRLRLNENTKGINLSPSTLDLVPGETATYTVELRGGAPTADVTVTPASSDTDKATVSGAPVFTSTAHTTAKDVTVQAVAVGAATISHAATSSDATYSLASDALGSVKVTVEAAENTYQITPAAAAAEGETAELTITLGALAPTGDLGLSVDRSRTGVTTNVDDRTADPASDLSSPASSVTVSATERRATLTETFADDDLVEGDEHYYVVISPGAGVTGWSKSVTHANCDQDAACAKVTITDPDTEDAQIAFGNAAGSATRYAGSVNEGGGTLDVPVTINALPGKPTTFNILVATTGSGLATEGADYSIAAKSVTFASNATDTALTKNVTVAITEDTDLEGNETIQMWIAPADAAVDDLGDYYRRDSNGSQAMLTITDNDGDVEVSRSSVAVREDTTATYTVRLVGAVPTSTVTITPTSDDTDKATVSCAGSDPCALEFTSDNYRQTQTITVSGVALGSVTISHAVSGSDPVYQSTMTVDSVTVTVASGVLAELSVSPNPVREGRAVTVTVELSEAAGAVKTVPIALGDPSDTAERDDHGTLANVSFNARSTRATGRIATSQDLDTEDETFTVALGALPSSLSPGSTTSVLVTIEDDDTPIAAVSDLAVHPGDTELEARWKRPVGTHIPGYDVHYTSADEQTVPNAADAVDGGDPAAAWVDANHSGTSLWLRLENLTNDTDYRVRVRAANDAEQGPWEHGSATPAEDAEIPPRPRRGGGSGGGGTPAQPSGAALSSITLTVGGQSVALAETWAAGRMDYTASVNGSSDVLTVSADAAHNAATMVITPADADAGMSGHQVHLNSGENRIAITVTAQNGTSQTYTVTVTRAEAPAPVEPAEFMAPSNVRANPAGSRSVIVEWDTVSRAAGFIIIAVNIADPSLVVSKAVNNPDATSSTIANLTAGGEYNIYVAAFRSVEEFEIDLTQKARVMVE